jgi:hypothetical protein
MAVSLFKTRLLGWLWLPDITTICAIPADKLKQLNSTGAPGVKS